MQVEAARHQVSSTFQRLKQVNAQLMGAPTSALGLLCTERDALQFELRRVQSELDAMQAAPALYAGAPYVAVWDSHADQGADGLALLCRIDFPPEGGGGGGAPTISSRSAPACLFGAFIKM